MSVPITPRSEYVVARQEAAESKTASGIYLPDNATEKPKTAKVEAVGKKVDDIKVGDRILYKSYGPVEVKVAGETYLLINEEDILATVK
jgi:chaperonin GroES